MVEWMMLQRTRKQPSIKPPAATNFFVKSKLEQDEDVTRAEVLFANCVAEFSAFWTAIPYYLLFVEILKIDLIKIDLIYENKVMNFIYDFIWKRRLFDKHIRIMINR